MEECVRPEGSALRRLAARLRRDPLLFALLAAQLVFICYINLFRLDCYLGYDCSTNYLQVMEMWRQRSLVLADWAYQSTLALDYPVLLAVPLYGLLGDVFLAYGLANLLVTAAFVAALAALARECGLDARARLLLLVLALTPYYFKANRANDLGYFSMMFVSMAAYSLRMVVILLTWRLFARLWQGKPTRAGGWAAVLGLCTLSAVSSGMFVLAFGVAPLLACYLLRGALERRWRERGLALPLFLTLAVLLSVAGRFLAQRALGASIVDAQMSLVRLDEFWGNLGSIFTGYLKLMRALPLTGAVPLLSADGVRYAMFFVLAAALLVCAAIETAELVKKRRWDSPRFPAAVVVAAELLVLVLVRTNYGELVFEERYLIAPFLLLLLLAAARIAGTVLAGRVSALVKWAALLCILGANLVSFRAYAAEENDMQTARAIAQTVQGYDTPVVYVGGADLRQLGRDLRVLDPDAVYKCSSDASLRLTQHWGDYTRYDEICEREGPVLLLARAAYYEALPAGLLAAFQWMETIEGTDINLYRAQEVSLDWESGLPDTAARALDFPDSPGYVLVHGWTDADGSFVTDGRAGYVLYGPYTPVYEGVYDFTLRCELLDAPDAAGELGYFDIAVDAVERCAAPLQPGESELLIPGVRFTAADAGGRLECRVFVSEGVVLRVRSIEITRVG